MWTTLFNTVYITGGLSVDGEDLAPVAVSLALEISDELARRMQQRVGGRFRVALAGGPAVKMVVGGEMQIWTDTLDLVAEMLAAMPHTDTLIASRSFKKALSSRSDLTVAQGPDVMGTETFFAVIKSRARGTMGGILPSLSDMGATMVLADDRPMTMTSGGRSGRRKAD
jgi:hypothetical protein